MKLDNYQKELAAIVEKYSIKRNEIDEENHVRTAAIDEVQKKITKASEDMKAALAAGDQERWAAAKSSIEFHEKRLDALKVATSEKVGRMTYKECRADADKMYSMVDEITMQLETEITEFITTLIFGKDITDLVASMGEGKGLIDYTIDPAYKSSHIPDSKYKYEQFARKVKDRLANMFE